MLFSIQIISEKNMSSHAFSATKTDLVLIWHIGATTNNQIPSYDIIASKCTCRIFRRVNKFAKLLTTSGDIINTHQHMLGYTNLKCSRNVNKRDTATIFSQIVRNE